MNARAVRLYGILGEKIDYSLSPLIFNHLFRARNLPAVYAPFDVKRPDVKKFIDFSRLIGLAGFNVTVPHKEFVCRYLDRRDAIVAATGSVNLVLNENGRLAGYNTDIAGIAGTIEEKLRLDVARKSILIVGAGGAARTVSYYLARHRSSALYLVNRTESRFRSWRKYLRSLSSSWRIATATMSEFRLEAPPAIDLCVNCTPIPVEKLITKAILRRCRSLFELRYSPGFCEKASHVDGKYMLAVQAAENWKLMTGSSVSPRQVLKLITEALRS